MRCGEGGSRYAEAACSAGAAAVLRRTLHLGLLADALHTAGAHDEARDTSASAAAEIGARGEYFCYRPQWPFARLLPRAVALTP
ncbi:hypothetical protein [Streptomyces sp. NPDC058989]|uniref:hypothetical protein n=1 Tax=Streptomyces sp. NPDC058989 TaxID=3346686 RepID=UPI003676A312